MHRDVQRATVAVGLVVGINLLVGFLGYFVAFLFAYGFVDEVGVAHHVVFLALVGVIAAVGAAVSTPLVKASSGMSTRRSAALAFRVSAATHLFAVGVGSVISSRYKDAGSVSAAFSTTTDVLVAAGLFLCAAVAGWLAWRSLPEAERTRA